MRKGFILGVLGCFCAVGSTLWAIATLPYLPGHPIPLTMALPPPPPATMATRPGLPPVLSWFFVEYPFVSNRAHLTMKNHHTYVIDDDVRARLYVVEWGQRFRRVEIYFDKTKRMHEVQIFRPGVKRTVWFKNDWVTSDASKDDANAWMFADPLWDGEDLKIYALADVWQDAPYKRYSCAGFVHQFLTGAGISLPLRNAWDYAKEPWTRIAPDEMEPGDIITIRAATARHRRFWHHEVTHVAVYLGNGMIIHAATASPRSKRSWVRITSLDRFRHRIDKILRPPALL